MMAMSIACPLCSQVGFPDVNSLWLTLIRATTRQLSCPVCQEILFGLDKLTIHLVSHSLHDQLVQACLSTNLSATPAIHDKSHNVPSLSVSQETIPTNDENKIDAPVASYVLINFPTIENVSIENSGEISVVPHVEANVIENVKSIPSLSQDISFSALSSPKVPSQDDVSFPALLNIKSNNAASAPNHSPVPENVASDLCDPMKLITSSQPLYGDENVAAEISCVIKEQDRPLITESSIILGQSSSPQCSVQSEGDHSSNPNLQVTSVCATVSASASNGIQINGYNLKTEGSVISCGICGLSFKDENIVMLHQQLIHDISSGDEKRYQSSPKHEDRGFCSKQWSKRGTTASQSTEALSPLHRFPCHICNKVFRMRGSLMVHLRVAHSPVGTVGLASRLGSSPCGKTPIGDVICKLSLQALSIEEAKASSVDKACSSGNTFYVSPSSTHKVHEQTSINNFGSVSALSPKLSPTQSPPVQSTSTESFSTIFPCNLCSKTFSKDTLLTQHLKSHESKQWECDVCFKSFTTKYFLKKHKRLHTGEMPYTCGICNKSFTFQQSYHKHLLYHSDEKPHSCSECGRAFKELSTLHNHQRIHTGEKPWACETCGKCFRQRVSYLVHRRIHTGAMPYQCNVCLKSFRYKVSQRTHKCVAQPTGDIPTQSNDLPQQLLQTPGKEMDSAISVQPPVSVTFKETSTLLKEQMQQLNIKQEHQHMNATNISLPPGDKLGNHFLVGNESDRLLPLNNCNKTGEQPSLQHHLVGSHLSCNVSHHRSFSEFLSHAGKSDAASKVASPHSTKLSTNYNFEKLEAHGSVDSSLLAAPLPQSTSPPSTDFNIDLLQDILSMVMSPTSENAPSPSTQMRHLSLTGSQNDDDLEAGLELRQLLYGSCDSQSTP